jgi:hypothetical protein
MNSLTSRIFFIAALTISAGCVGSEPALDPGYGGLFLDQGADEIAGCEGRIDPEQDFVLSAPGLAAPEDGLVVVSKDDAFVCVDTAELVGEELTALGEVSLATRLLDTSRRLRAMRAQVLTTAVTDPYEGDPDPEPSIDHSKSMRGDPDPEPSR